MQPIDVLPDIALQPGTLLADALLTRGSTTFQAACRWVQALPYGPNRASRRPMAIFEDGCGTCVAKHGTIARLAVELGLPVFKNLGFYRLTDDIISGVGALLEPYELAFVPASHCFLEYGAHRIDLTAGNRTGKNCDLEVFDQVVRVAPDPAPETLQHLHSGYFRACAVGDPRLAELGEAAVRELTQRAHHLALRRLARSAAVQGDVVALP
ncbi:MAG: hypothetical protein AB7N65_25165 [Vicinamibacterales bacterium]